MHNKLSIFIKYILINVLKINIYLISNITKLLDYINYILYKNNTEPF